MKEKKVLTFFEELRDDIAKYITCTLELGKLEVFEKISLGSSMMVYLGLVLGIGLIVLLLILLTLGLYLGELLEKMWLGFAIVAGVSLLIMLVIALCRNSIKRKVANKAVRFLTDKSLKQQKEPYE